MNIFMVLKKNSVIIYEINNYYGINTKKNTFKDLKVFNVCF
jgi:hypothetical protein